MEAKTVTQPIPKGELRRLGIGGVIIIFVALFVALCVGPIRPGGNMLSKAQIGEAQGDRVLCEFGQRVLDYKRAHGGASPQQVSDLVASDEIEFEKSIHRTVDAYMENPIFSFALPNNPASHVLIFEKPGLWSDGTIGVCFDDLTVKRLSPAEFAALGK
jgi:hypothetical protein